MKRLKTDFFQKNVIEILGNRISLLFNLPDDIKFIELDCLKKNMDKWHDYAKIADDENWIVECDISSMEEADIFLVKTGLIMVEEQKNDIQIFVGVLYDMSEYEDGGYGILKIGLISDEEEEEIERELLIKVEEHINEYSSHIEVLNAYLHAKNNIN